MAESFVLRHRLKLFILLLVVAGTVGGVIVKTKLDDIKMQIFDTALAENQGAGFSRVVSAMSEAGAYVDAKTEPGSIDQAQGYRYVLRQAAQWQTLFMADMNADAPSISRCPSRMCKYGFDNPDTVYQMINPISPKNQYILKGRRGTSAYTTYQVFGISGASGFQTGGTLEGGDIEAGEDGSFEILISRDNPGGHPNHIAIPDGRGGQVVIRQLMRDWNTETENTYALEIITPDPKVPSPPRTLDLQMFDRRAIAFSQFLADRVKGYREILENEPVNELAKGRGGSGVGDGGFPTNFTSQMRYSVKDGEALLIEIPHVDVVYSNIQLGSLWGESLVYGARTVSFNDFQAHKDDDGIYRYVVALEDPGVPNWLDASGHPEGGLFHRWQSPDTELPVPSTKLVPLAELRDHLPASHPLVSPADRAEQLRLRHAGYLRRMNPGYE